MLLVTQVFVTSDKLVKLRINQELYDLFNKCLKHGTILMISTIIIHK